VRPARRSWQAASAFLSRREVTTISAPLACRHYIILVERRIDLAALEADVAEIEQSPRR
jgi:hypothetical protein